MESPSFVNSNNQRNSQENIVNTIQKNANNIMDVIGNSINRLFSTIPGLKQNFETGARVSSFLCASSSLSFLCSWCLTILLLFLLVLSMP